MSLSTLAWATQASAETTIDGSRTTPVATSTAASGAPDSISITSSGSVEPGSGVAVTLDSSHSVSNAGTIDIEDANDSTGILAIGGNAGSVTNSGTIQIDETTEAADDDEDGDDDGSFVVGARRYGVRVIGSAPLTGDVTNSGYITVEGDDSAGISVETGLTGSLSNSGSISVVGARSYGLRTTGEISGDVSITGSVSVVGENARAISLEGDILGGVTIQSSIVATGYRSTGRSTDPDVLAALDADDLLQGGPAVSIAGDVAGGLLIDAPPADNDEDNDDEDGDGTDDSAEGTGVVASYGAAPALVVGAVGGDVTLGNVGSGDDAYGVVVRGTVSGSGVYDGVAAVGLQLGVEGGGRVDAGGGVSVAGSVTATAYEADATALLLKDGATAPLLRIDGGVSAAAVAENEAAARAIVLEAGAAGQMLQNAGTISAAVSGERGDAIAIHDGSGTLTSIQNIGSISAVITATDDDDDADDDDTDASNETVTGRAVAIDVSANTTGVAVLQYDESDGETPPEIVGSILFGSGDDRLDVLGGSVTGDVAFGAGANALAIDGGATVTGRITADGGALALSIGEGVLQVTNAATLQLSALSLGAASELVLTADPATGDSTRLEVSGLAEIADGAKLGLRLTSLLQDEATYTLIQADALSVGAIDTTLLGSMPYLYGSQLITDPAAGSVSVTLARKSAGELGLSATTQGAYEPIVAVIAKDAELEQALLAQTDRAGFLGLYNQMLPNHSGGVFRMAQAASNAAARPVDDRHVAEGGGFWLQELNYGLTADGSDDAPGYTAWGFGLVGGYELPATRFGVFGLTLGGTSGELEDDDAAVGESLVVSQVEGGAYWRVAAGRLTANARVAADYLSVKSDRVVLAVTDDLQTSRTAEAGWSGLGLAARLRAAYQLDWGGPLYARPEVSLDYFRLREGSYEEAGGGEAVDLAVKSRTSSALSALAGLAVGASFGEEVSWGPELMVGWRQVASETLGDTRARFLSGGEAFRLSAEELDGQGLAARLSFKSEGTSGGFVVEAGAEMRDDVAIYDLRLSAHFRF